MFSWICFAIFSFFQTATIQSYRSQDCCKYTNNDYDCNTNNVVIDDSVLCAGSTTQKIGVCFGDSGGPLIYFNGSHNLLGECIQKIFIETVVDVSWAVEF